MSLFGAAVPDRRTANEWEFTPILDEVSDEAHHVSLDRVIGPAHLKLSDAPWTNAVVAQKVAPKNLYRSRRGFVAEKRPQALEDILDAGAIVAHDVEQVVGILVLTPEIESQRLEHDIGSGAADPDVAGRVFSGNRLA